MPQPTPQTLRRKQSEAATAAVPESWKRVPVAATGPPKPRSTEDNTPVVTPMRLLLLELESLRNTFRVFAVKTWPPL